MDARVELGIRQKLEWAAVNHHDAERTPNARVVVVVRGSIARDATCCLTECMSRIGCAWATAARLSHDRATTLDHDIEKRAVGERIELRVGVLSDAR
jgi:hypothetical protein